MIITQRELDILLEKHRLWLEGNKDGQRLQLFRAELARLSFNGKDLVKAVFESCNFLECDFSDVFMSDTMFIHCSILESSFRNSTSKDSLFKHCNINNVDWTRGILDGTCISLSTVSNVKFNECKLFGADYYNSKLESCDFNNTICKGVLHLSLFSFNWIGDELETFVYLHNQNTIWFKGYKGSLDSFTKILVSGGMGITEFHRDILLHVCVMLSSYAESKEDEVKWRTSVS